MLVVSPIGMLDPSSLVLTDACGIISQCKLHQVASELQPESLRNSCSSALIL